MMAAVATTAPVAANAGPRCAAACENAVVALLFAAAVIVPLAEGGLRASLGIGIEGAAEITQHLTLAVGMLGAAIAARDGRLLTLAVAGAIKGRLAPPARWLSAAVAAAVALLLALAAADLVAADAAAGAKLVRTLPAWVGQLPLVVGFALIAARLARHAADAWWASLAAMAVAVLLAMLLRTDGALPGWAVGATLITLGTAAAMGAPLFAVIGGAALVLLQGNGVPAAAVAVNHYGMAGNPSLPAIPMFTLAGYLLAESRAPARLVEVFTAALGRLHGGAAAVTVLACTFFTCFTGASGVTILALGGLVMPMLLRAGYRTRDALGLVTGAGLPGVLLVPSLPLLLYAIVAGVAIDDMFRGGLLPAALMIGMVAAWGVWRQPACAAACEPFSWPRLRGALARAKWELALPIVPLGAMGTGLATPVEAAAATALGGFMIVTVVHRDLGLLRDAPRVLGECALIVGAILLVLGVALSLTNHLVDAEVPDRIIETVQASIHTPLGFLLALNAVLLVAGCVMDIYTAIVVLAPLVAPLGAAYGIHPVHLGIVFLANLEVGYLTPPVGMNLFFAAYRFGKPIPEVVHAVLPLLAALAAALAVITCTPWLSTALLAP
jgi:tripartite ATP-independent transporter DctM subunit